jgi:hypothetical protein
MYPDGRRLCGTAPSRQMRNVAALPQARKDGLSSESGATHGTRRGPVNYRQRGVCTAAISRFQSDRGERVSAQ